MVKQSFIKHFIPFLVLLLLCTHSFSQDAATDLLAKNRLYNEVISYNQIELKYIGCFGHASRFYPVIDSFIKLFPPNEFIKYFDDSNHILKYYAYMSVLCKLTNDSIAVSKLTSVINDSAKIDYGFPGSNSGTINFNKLIASEYYCYLKQKYITGGPIGYRGNFSAIFSKPDKRLYRKKVKELNTLLLQINLNTTALEDYCR